jgi:hypothetical protein
MVPPPTLSPIPDTRFPIPRSVLAKRRCGACQLGNRNRDSGNRESGTGGRRNSICITRSCLRSCVPGLRRLHCVRRQCASGVSPLPRTVAATATTLLCALRCAAPHDRPDTAIVRLSRMRLVAGAAEPRAFRVPSPPARRSPRPPAQVPRLARARSAARCCHGGDPMARRRA